ncbi:recQ-mediated genome instability protein 1 isoform X2 [Peromyscus leucopus]|uniref:recQ-mediated genome instability protein 1 isoform X2 n=1 Tax=Peromyscus leucopus TaxID=10041 RepID=UPI001884AC13|nr:recQ-mediated genome instability protein 1 isoform X2 [Peromyscus leucopus]
MDAPIGRNRERGERDGGVRAAEKQRIMASAALWPGAPSSFLVRALWSEGEGKSGAPLARFEAAVHVWREGAAQGCLRAPRGICGIGGGRPLRAKSGGERRRRTLGRRSAAGCVLSGARPRDEAGRPGSFLCSRGFEYSTGPT